MSEKNQVDRALDAAASAFKRTKKPAAEDKLFCGVDLGTASIIMVVLNGEGKVLASEMETAQVAKDGLVVDYIGAVEIVKRLKEKLEARLGATLEHAAIAVPPGTEKANASTHLHIVEGAGMEVEEVLDEPTAANLVLGIQNGVVVDIGGGTTGLSVLKDGEVVYTADEATGGTHVSLVLMGRHKITFEEAEAMKQDPARSKEVLTAIRPVLEKMAQIVKTHVDGYDVREVWLVGGTCCLAGIEDVFTKYIGIEAKKPSNPMLVTPLGIAMSGL